MSSRSAASPRGSLGDGMSGVHGVGKARSTATVSFSDIISTRFVPHVENDVEMVHIDVNLQNMLL